ncbi:uncharacterized protein BO95DRAFT_444128 [Aspergillus brunneoviolaceus CBS 621.78]|uniref:Uncharacterized protein n=1 Tax=Aspergillus brunneoviolaceus CBS 621.78 TaxID=1450534 RepID=A0ACD1G5I4_9EURO|nr:hypothetical protein BO95DRAFT_444128 [Aspergillus brunneoviolaceus CBS 621.78]RAH44496.1 hypothetical protein BO95DRAFT_444128 [Aspergillus brunneoviolaceus CBS 621.78]
MLTNRVPLSPSSNTGLNQLTIPNDSSSRDWKTPVVTWNQLFWAWGKRILQDTRGYTTLWPEQRRNATRHLSSLLILLGLTLFRASCSYSYSVPVSDPNLLHPDTTDPSATSPMKRQDWSRRHSGIQVPRTPLSPIGTR